MRRNNEHRIASLLDQFIKENNLEQGLAEYRVKKSWSELLGRNVSMATRSIYIKDRKLFVKLHSSVIRNELSLLKEDLMKKLNESAGSEVITDIILR
ncbi:MAG: DUF721 domain-containing protein [Bacteroidales bacterium]|nr:DUF721 domain-containing protein [Bacteroidales bacterium]